MTSACVRAHHRSGYSHQAPHYLIVPEIDMIKRQCLLLLSFGLLLFSPDVHAQQETSPDLNSAMPRCGPPMDGQVFCKFGTIYECQFVDPNSHERRTGWRWKSDILRTCMEPRQENADRRHELPPGFTYAPQYNGNTGFQPGLDVPPSRPGRSGYPYPDRGGYPYPTEPSSPYPVYRRN